MTLVAASATSRLEKRDAWALVGLLAIGVVLPTIVGAVSGSLDIPRNDDWSYRGIALHLFETGRLELDGAAATMLVGQILIAQPFLWLSGGATWGLTVVGVLSAVVGIVAGYLLVRRLVTPGRAALAMLLLPLFPGFLPYAALVRQGRLVSRGQGDPTGCPLYAVGKSCWLVLGPRSPELGFPTVYNGQPPPTS